MQGNDVEGLGYITIRVSQSPFISVVPFHHYTSVVQDLVLCKMLTSTLLSALAAAATASAAKTYLAYAWNDTAPEIHGMAVQARNGYFYLGGQTYPVCADDDFDCAVQNKTILKGPTTSKYSNNNDGFFMDILDSQPQEVVTLPRTGEVVYTLPKTELAHEETVTSGSINTPFSVDHDDFSDQTVLRFNGNDWVSCPTHQQYADYGYQPYSIRALSYGDLIYKEGLVCTPFKMRLVETDLPAPQYYKYPCTPSQGELSGQPGHITCPDAMLYDCTYDDYCSAAQDKAWAIRNSTYLENYGSPHPPL